MRRARGCLPMTASFAAFADCKRALGRRHSFRGYWHESAASNITSEVDTRLVQALVQNDMNRRVIMEGTRAQVHWKGN